MGAVGRLRKGNLGRRPGKRPLPVEVHHPHVRQAIGAFDQHGEGLKELQLFQHHVFAVGDQLAPVRAAGGGNRGGDHAEGSCRVVDANVPEPIPVVGVVLDVLAARFDQRPASFRIAGGEKLLFAGGVAGAFEHDVLVVAGAAGADIEAFIGFFVDQGILGLRSAYYDGGRAGTAVWFPHPRRCRRASGYRLSRRRSRPAAPGRPALHPSSGL